MGHVDIVRLMWTLNVISQITLICFRGITDMEFDLAVRHCRDEPRSRPFVWCSVSAPCRCAAFSEALPEGQQEMREGIGPC